MKRIVATIKPNMLDDVIFALHNIRGFPGAAIWDVRQIGGGSGGRGKPVDRTPLHEFPRLVGMEIVCRAELAEELVETILQKAHTGLPDDGRISVSAVEDVVWIRTGRRGVDETRE